MDVKEKVNRRLYTGAVISDKMEKTVVVEITTTFKDKRFHKIRRKTKKYKIHDENGTAKKGDVVEFYEGKPVSKTKYMYLARIVKTQSV